MVHVRLAVLLVPPPHLVATGDLAGTVEHHAWVWVWVWFIDDNRINGKVEAMIA